MPKRESGEAPPVPRAKLTTRSVLPRESALGSVKGESKWRINFTNLNLPS